MTTANCTWQWLPQESCWALIDQDCGFATVNGIRGVKSTCLAKVVKHTSWRKDLQRRSGGLWSEAYRWNTEHATGYCDTAEQAMQVATLAALEKQIYG